MFLPLYKAQKQKSQLQTAGCCSQVFVSGQNVGDARVLLG